MIDNINPGTAQQISKLHNYSRPVFTSHNHISLPFLYTLYHTDTIFEKEMCVVVLSTTFSESLHVVAKNQQDIVINVQRSSGEVRLLN
jgi:hypothetical protein